MKKKILKKYVFTFLIVCAILTPINFAFPFAFIFSGEDNGVDVVCHPIGYTGTGETIMVSVGIDPVSANVTDMQIPTQNVIQVFNNLVSTTGNVEFGVIGGSEFDFESVLLHELGHSLGLAHCNAATESGLSGSNLNFTKATDGVNNAFNINSGADLVIGSADDLRGDDVNLNYFKTADNNPFTTPGSNIFDSTTYNRDLANLPGSDSFSTNGDRAVSTLLGTPNTEAVMQQGTFSGEIQRSLTADDVAGIRYAMAGVDEIQGTADDYNLVLTYAGLDAGANIVIDFDSAQTGFAVSQSGGFFIGASDHVRIADGSNIFWLYSKT